MHSWPIYVRKLSLVHDAVRILAINISLGSWWSFLHYPPGVGYYWMNYC